jgi:hypothetical protein
MILNISKLPRLSLKSILNISKRAARRKLQTQPKIIIKWPDYQIENFPEKVCLVLLKRKPAQNLYYENPTKFAVLTQNPKIIIRTRNQPIRTFV